MKRLWLKVVVSVVVCTAVLGVLYALGLPALGALPPGVTAWDRLLSALPAGLAALVVFRLRYRALEQQDRPVGLVCLPTQVVISFAVVAGLSLPIGAWLVSDSLLARRPAALLIGGPALAVAVALLLHALLRPMLMGEVSRLLGHLGLPQSSEPHTGRGPWRWWGAIALRRALFLATVAVAGVALTLAAIHTRSQLRQIEDEQTRQHLEALARVAGAHVLGLTDGQARARYFTRFPGSPQQATVALLDARGQVLHTASPGLRGQTIADKGAGRCSVGQERWPCVLRTLRAGLRLAVVGHPSTPRAGSGSALLGGGLLLLASLLGLLVGRDFARDLDHVTLQLRAMAAADRVDLGRAVPVASLDEVGELVQAVGQLRSRLETDMGTYAASLEGAREAERVKNQFISDVSHELRTPLNSLCGYAQLLLEGIEGELTGPQREDVEVISKGARQLLSLINDVLDMSVMETGKLNLMLEDVDLGALCQQAFDQHEAIVRSGRASKLSLHAEIAADLPTLRADGGRVLQIIQNLLTNAVKFTRRGQVWLRARRDGDEHALIEIEDTGPGISSVDLPLIFEEYRQAGGMRARRAGTGLGLAISKRLVELHGGTIEVTSAIGQGSTFTVRLPTAGPEAKR
jgi:signal transduction histidine kinase